MLTLPDFEKKQVIFIFLMIGEKISFNNDNLIVTDKDGAIRLQTTCYRIFAIFIVGSFTLTTGIIQRAQKFAFPIFLLTQAIKVFDKIGFTMKGNVILRRLQYNYSGLDLAKHIVFNKISNQLNVLKSRREKNDNILSAIQKIEQYLINISNVNNNIHELLSIEGNCAKIYFKYEFDNVNWIGRKARVKLDYVNASLDIGYTLLFNIIESLLDIYGFDTYCGVLHKEFYMRKSLVCDIIEPFRVIIDNIIRKGINLGQIKPEDFNLVNGSYKLNWDYNKRYVKMFILGIMKYKQELFLYIQSFYRSFMKKKKENEFPIFAWSTKQ